MSGRGRTAALLRCDPKDARLGRSVRRLLAALLVVSTASLGACSPSKTSSDKETSSSSNATPAAADPDVDPGELWIAYQWAAPDGSDGIFLVRPDGQGDHQLMPDMPGAESHPDWSPDGERLAFVHATPSERTELWVVRVELSPRAWCTAGPT